MSKRTWIVLGFALPVLTLFMLLGWALVKSGGNPGGFGVNNSFGKIEVSQEPASGFSLELLDGSTLPCQSCGEG